MTSCASKVERSIDDNVFLVSTNGRMTSAAIDSACSACAYLLSSSKKQAMKILSENTKKNQLWKWGKRICTTESAITLGNVKSRVPFPSCCGLYLLRKLIWKLRTQWKQALGWQRSSVQFSYDIHSYSLNFDDGLHHGHHPSKRSQFSNQS